MDDGWTVLPLLRALAILSPALLLSPCEAAKSQTPPPQVDTLKVYEMALQANRDAPRSVDSAALRLSRNLVDAQDTLIVIDQELLVVGHALGTFIANKNPGKEREGRLFTEQEIIPTLFQNFETFRDLFAISVADTFSIEDLKSMESQGDLGSQKIDAEKSGSSAAKFHNAAMVFGGSLLAKLSMGPDNRLTRYGLK
jgi:hypothetical protein